MNRKSLHVESHCGQKAIVTKKSLGTGSHYERKSLSTVIHVNYKS